MECDSESSEENIWWLLRHKQTADRIRVGGASGVEAAVRLLHAAAASESHQNPDTARTSENDVDAAVAAAARTVVENIPCPHIDITTALIDVLVLYPRATLPYVADIISSDPVQVAMVFAAYRELLSGDRSLLVPISASFADLPLNRSQVRDVEKTLTYALSAVDEVDMPTVVRAALRTACTSSSGSPLWAAHHVRRNTPNLDPGVFVLVAEVVRDACRINGATTRGFLKAAGAPVGAGRAAKRAGVSVVDLVAWATALESFRDYSSAAKSALDAARTGAFGIGVVGTLLERYKEALLPGLEGLRRLTLVLARDSSINVEIVFEICGQLLISFPQLRSELIGDLIRSRSTGSFRTMVHLSSTTTTSESLASNAHLLEESLYRPETLEPHHHKLLCLAVANTIAARSVTSSNLFILIRKHLLFGESVHRRCAVVLAAALIGKMEGHAELNELVTLLDQATPKSLSDDSAVELLRALTCRTAMLDRGVARDVYFNRIAAECPHGFVDRTEGEIKFHLDKVPTEMSAEAVSALCASIAAFEAIVGDRLATSLLQFSSVVPVEMADLCQQADLNIRLRSEKDSDQLQRAAESVSPTLRANVCRLLLAGAALTVGIVNLAAENDYLGVQALTSRDRSTFVQRILDWDRLYTAAMALGSPAPDQTVMGERPSPLAIEKTLTTLTDKEEAACATERVTLEHCLLGALLDSEPSHYPDQRKPSDEFVLILAARLKLYATTQRRLRIDQATATANGDSWESAALARKTEMIMESSAMICRLLQSMDKQQVKVAMEGVNLESEEQRIEFVEMMIRESLHPAQAALAIDTFGADLDDNGAYARLWFQSITTVYEMNHEAFGRQFLTWKPNRSSLWSQRMLGRNRTGYVDRYRLAAYTSSLSATHAVLELCGWIRSIYLVLQHRDAGRADSSRYDGEVPSYISRGISEAQIEFIIDMATAVAKEIGIVQEGEQIAVDFARSKNLLRAVDGIVHVLSQIARRKDLDCSRCILAFSRLLREIRYTLRRVIEASTDQSVEDDQVADAHSCFALARNASNSTLDLVRTLKKRPRNRGQDSHVVKSIPRLSFLVTTLLDYVERESLRYHVDLEAPVESMMADKRYSPGCGLRSEFSRDSSAAHNSAATTIPASCSQSDDRTSLDDSRQHRGSDDNQRLDAVATTRLIRPREPK